MAVENLLKLINRLIEQEKKKKEKLKVETKKIREINGPDSI